MKIAPWISSLFNDELPFHVEAYDGSRAAPAEPARANGLTLSIRRRDAIARALTRPGELGLARADAAGDLDVDGDLDGLFALSSPAPRQLLRPATLRALLTSVGVGALRPLRPPAIETRPGGPLHSRARDRATVRHHYDVSNRFYELVLGPSMTSSCAVFRSPEDTLEDAQRRKVDLVARKLHLAPGDRLLDVGCGWGAMAIHAAREYGARVVGVTLSEPQQRYATAAAAAAGVGHLVEVRVQDYRDVADGPFYAIGRPVSFNPDPRPSRVSETRHQVQVALGLR